jgi:hypothetical protein
MWMGKSDGLTSSRPIQAVHRFLTVVFTLPTYHQMKTTTLTASAWTAWGCHLPRSRRSQSFFIGNDCRTYGQRSENDVSRSSIYSIEGESIIWSLTENGSFAVIKVWDDGRVLLKHTEGHFVNTNYSEVNVFEWEELLMIDPNGSSEWKIHCPKVDGHYSSSSVEIADNGTIVLDQYAPDWIRTHGYDLSGHLIWTCFGSYDPSAQRPAYFGCQVRGSDGLHRSVESVFRSIHPLTPTVGQSFSMTPGAAPFTN